MLSMQFGINLARLEDVRHSRSSPPIRGVSTSRMIVPCSMTCFRSSLEVLDAGTAAKCLESCHACPPEEHVEIARLAEAADESPKTLPLPDAWTAICFACLECL